jgi:glycyl-tRNA synthetase
VLPVPAVEITYGLERIIMALQGVKHFKDIRYTDTLTYGELFMQNEYEMSVFNMDEADVEEHKQVTTGSQRASLDPTAFHFVGHR